MLMISSGAKHSPPTKNDIRRKTPEKGQKSNFKVTLDDNSVVNLKKCRCKVILGMFSCTELLQITMVVDQTLVTRITAAIFRGSKVTFLKNSENKI